MLFVESEVRSVKFTPAARVQIVFIITSILIFRFQGDKGRVRGGISTIFLVLPYFVPARVWILGTLISSIWRCPNRRQHFASAPASQR